MINKDDFLESLDNYLNTEEAKELELVITGDEQVDAPAINSLQRANYVVKVINGLNEDITKINEICDEELQKVLDRINSFRETEINALQKQVNYHTKLLRNFTEHELEGKKTRSVKLLNGTLSLSRQQPEWSYKEDEVMKWLTEKGATAFITTKVEEKINKKELKKNFVVDSTGNVTLNGELVPGISVTEREDKFSIK